MAFRIWQKVVCVKVPTNENVYLEARPEKGSVYTIREIVDCDCGRCMHTYLRLSEIVNEIRMYKDHDGNIVMDEPAFGAHCFRPVRTTDIGIFRQMLKPAKEDA